MTTKNIYLDIKPGNLYIDFHKNSIQNFTSVYYPYKYAPVSLTENSFENILNFINYDFSELNNLFQDIIANILNYNSCKELEEKYRLLGNKLIECHPFFKYNLDFYILDMLIYHYIIHLPYNGTPKIMNDEISRKIDIICNKLSTTLYNSTQPAKKLLSKKFKETYCDNSDIVFRILKVPAPLGYLEDFQLFLIQHMPTVRYDSATKLNTKSINNKNKANIKKNYDDNKHHWDIFFKDAINYYGELTHKMGDATPARLNTFLNINKELHQNSQRYLIESFEQYIIIQLLSFKHNKSAIKFCNNCGQYYLQPSEQAHNCISSDYHVAMNQIKNTAYARIRARFHYNASSSPSPEDIRAENNFRDFENYIFRYAMLKRIPSDVYEKYTREENYYPDRYLKLPHIREYAPEN